MKKDVPQSKVAELYGAPTFLNAKWPALIAEEHCLFWVASA
jgi:hypothetical protein